MRCIHALPQRFPWLSSLPYLSRYVPRNLTSIQRNGRSIHYSGPCHEYHRTATDLRQWFYIYRRYLQSAWRGCKPDHQNPRAKISELPPKNEAFLLDNAHRNFVQILRGWGKTWDIPLDDDEPTHGKKLRRWIEEDPERGSNVQETLYAISGIFGDTKNLEKKYGVVIERMDENLHKLNIKDVLDGGMNKKIGKQDVKVIRDHMDIVMRCHFKLRGETRFAALVERLKEFVDNLLKMCSEVQAQRIENAILRELSSDDNPDHLRSISKVYEQEAVDRKKAGRRYQGYELIKEVASFKARLQNLAEKRAEETTRRRALQQTDQFLLSTCFLDVNEFQYDFGEWRPPKNTLTLASVNRLDALRYIEWKSYEDQGQRNSVYESHVLELADFLGVQNRPAAFQVLPCLGVFRDEARLRYGFAFEPPSYIRNLTAMKVSGRDDGFSSWVPVTLLNLIQQRVLPLGDRFSIARKLAQTLYVMHATGWVHKNIRPSSVIFVPAEEPCGGVPSISGAIDLANPYLAGFDYSRPEAARIPEPEPEYDYQRRMHTNNPYKITLDLYQHPRKRLDPEIRYSQAFDLYSLGLVLLEIAGWVSFETSYDKGESELEFRKSMINAATKELPGLVGNIYAEAVKECLISSEDDSDPYTQERLCWKVNAALDQCIA